MLLFGKSQALGALFLPQSHSPHPLHLCSPRGPAWEQLWWLGWVEGHIRSTGRGRGGRNWSFWQEGASWDLPHFQANPQGHTEESSLLPSTFLSLFPSTPLPGMTQPWLVLAFVCGTPDWLNQFIVDDSLGTFLVQCLVWGPCCGCPCASLLSPDPL